MVRVMSTDSYLKIMVLVPWCNPKGRNSLLHIAVRERSTLHPFWFLHFFLNPTSGHSRRQDTGQQGRWKITLRTADLQNNELHTIHVVKMIFFCLLFLFVTDFCWDWGNFIYFCNVNGTPGYNLIKYLVLYSSPLKWMSLSGPSINKISLVYNYSNLLKSHMIFLSSMWQRSWQYHVWVLNNVKLPWNINCCEIT